MSLLGNQDQESGIRAWFARQFSDLDPDVLLDVWRDLEDARLGESGFGGDTAEIYAYRLLPFGPRHPLSDLAEDVQGQLAAGNLTRIARGFLAMHPYCEIRVGQLSHEQLMRDGVPPFTHRAHVQVRLRADADPAVTTPVVGDDETRFLLVRVDSGVDAASVRTTRFSDESSLLAHALGLRAPAVSFPRRTDLVSAFFSLLDREAVLALPSGSGDRSPEPTWDEDASVADLTDSSLDALDDLTRSGTDASARDADRATIGGQDLSRLVAEVRRRRFASRMRASAPVTDRSSRV